MLVSRTRFQKGRFGNTQSTKMHDEKRSWRNLIMHTLTGGKTHCCKACGSKNAWGKFQGNPALERRRILSESLSTCQAEKARISEGFEVFYG
jgi:hypothetical protein